MGHDNVPDNTTRNTNQDSKVLSTEAIAAINSATASAVQSAIVEAMKALAPIMASMALTPDKIAQLKAPYEDPAKKARFDREAKKSKDDEQEAARATALRRKACPHVYPSNGSLAINLVHNCPDRQPRGICVLCQDWIHPREWRIGPPTDKSPRGVAYLIDAHKDYRMVLQKEAQLLSGQ